MASKELDIKINLKDYASRGLTNVKGNLVGLSSAANLTGAGLAKLLGPLAAAVGSFLALGKAISVVTNATKSFADFDDVMRKAGAVTNATSEEMLAMTETAKRMGATTRYTSAQAAEGLSFLGMAGFSAKEAMTALPGVLQLAASAGIDLGTAADIASNVLSGFGLEVERLSSVNDVLAKAFTSTNTTLGSLGESFKYAGPVAKAVGGNFEDLVAAIGKLGDAGLQGTLAGTSLKGAMNALLAPSNEQKKIMAELGQKIGQTSLQVKDAEGNFIGFAGVIEQLEKAGADGATVLRLFGTEAGPGMANLLSVGSAELRRLTALLEKSQGTTKRIADTMEGGLGGALRNAKSAFEGMILTIGEAFGTKLINSIKDVTLSIQDFSATFKEMEESGLIDSIVKSIEFMIKSAEKGTKAMLATAQEFYNGYALISKTFSGDLEDAAKRLDKVGSYYRKLLQDSGVLASDEELQIKHIDRRISAIQREIDAKEQLLQQSLDDSRTWRGTIADMFGQDQVYVQQAQRYASDIDALKNKFKELQNVKFQLVAKIEKKQVAEEAKKAQEEVKKQVASGGPVGTAKRAGGLEVPIVVVSQESQLQAELIKLKASLETERTALEANYQEKLSDLTEYYNQRRQIVERESELEIKAAQAKFDAEADPSKKAVLEAQLFQIREKQIQSLIQLEAEYYNATIKKEEELRQEREKQVEAQRRVATVLSDIRTRVEAPSDSYDLEAKFKEELIALQQNQARELQIINESFDRKTQLVEMEAAQKEYYRQAELEKERLAANQYRRLLDQRLSWAQNYASDTASAMADLYKLTGEKQREFFYIAKAAALADVGISTAQGIMKAWSQGGMYGFAGAALVAVQGAIQTAKILSTGLAEGGKVPGYSPTNKSDNILARVTAGEYVLPVDSVKYYGESSLEALRKKAIPKDLFRGYSLSLPIKKSNFAFAEGGSVQAASQPMMQAQQQNQESITIINYTDPKEILSALASSQGVNAVVNIISSNREKISRVLR